MARVLIVEDNSELSSLIASAAKGRGHTVRRALTGTEALSALGHEPFDIAVVDLLLPDMRGSEVLGPLRERDVPAIAISGIFKGDKFAVEATEVHGARAFFEKPFQMEALLLKLEEIAGTPKVGLSEEDLESLETLEPLPDDDDDEPLGPRTPTPAIPKPTPAKKDAAPPWTHAGELQGTSVPRLLNAYHQARHAGELRLRQNAIVKVVLFEEGRPIYAASNVANERFGRFCVRRGVISQTDLPRVTQTASAEGIRTGEAMVRLGLLTPDARKKLLGEQIKEIIWTTFTWKTGQYRFLPVRPQREDLVKLSIFSGDLILEGVSKTESLVSLRQKVSPDRRLFPIADPPYDLHEITLSGDQALLMAYSDGSKTVNDLLQLTDLSEREALATLLGFEQMGLLEERRTEPRGQRISFGL